MADISGLGPLNILDSTGSFLTSINLRKRIAGGAAGDIFTIEGDELNLVKIFKHEGDRQKYDSKIVQMLLQPPAIPPFIAEGQLHHQLSWPNARCTDKSGGFLGYRMPRIPLENSESLERLMQKRMREIARLPEFYGYRVTCAANVSAVLKAIHKAGHCVVDLKPQNIQVYRDSMFIALLDSDGFRIVGSDNQIYPAHQFTPEYIAPEAIQRAPEELGFQQDLFALAVIIFRLLNNGLHPFQGAMKRKQLTIQEMVERNNYVYAERTRGDVTPSRMSILESFPKQFKDYFEKAFTTEERPTAEQWCNLLSDYANPTSGRLVRCSNHDDHAHFGLGCGLCALVENNVSKPMSMKNSFSKIQTGSNQIRVSPLTSYTQASVTAQKTLQQQVFAGRSLHADVSVFDIDQATQFTKLDSVKFKKLLSDPSIKGQQSWAAVRALGKGSIWSLRGLDAIYLTCALLTYNALVANNSAINKVFDILPVEMTSKKPPGESIDTSEEPLPEQQVAQSTKSLEDVAIGKLEVPQGKTDSTNAVNIPEDVFSTQKHVAQVIENWERERQVKYHGSDPIVRRRLDLPLQAVSAMSLRPEVLRQLEAHVGYSGFDETSRKRIGLPPKQ